MHGFPTRAPGHQSRDSTQPPPLVARTIPRPLTPTFTPGLPPAPRRRGLARDHPYPAWSPHSAERCGASASPKRVARCTQRTRSRNHGPSSGLTALRHPFACTPLARRLTHWPSPPQDAAATHLHTGLGHATPLHQRGPRCPLCQLWTCQIGHQSRRHTGYVTVPGRDYRGCLRLHNEHGAGDPGRPVTTPPA
jgi:hypothetical protein